MLGLHGVAPAEVDPAPGTEEQTVKPGFPCRPHLIRNPTY